MATGVTPATTPILPGPPLSPGAALAAISTGGGLRRPQANPPGLKLAPPARRHTVGSLLARRPAGHQPSVAPVDVIMTSA
jgi:hypothetical protein